MFTLPTVGVQIFEEDKDVKDHAERLGYGSKIDVIKLALKEFLLRNQEKLDKFREKRKQEQG